MKKAKTTAKQKILLLLFSLFLVFIVIELGFGKYIILSAQNLRNSYSSSENEQNVYKILALGESTTAGSWNSWPAQLEIILNNKSPNLKFIVYNEGLAGINTGYITASLEKNIEKYNPNMIITMMGINDNENNEFFIYKKEKSKIFSFFQNLFKPSKINKKINSIKQYSDLEIEYLEKAYFYMDEGNITSAIKILNKTLETNPEIYEAHLALGHIYDGKRDYESSKLAYENAIKSNPECDEALVFLGWAYVFEKENKKASELFKKALEINPNNGLAAFLLSSINRNSSEKILNRYQSMSVSSSHTLSGLEYTKYHYLRTYEILMENNIKFVAIQYPTLSVQIIKNFYEEDKQKKVIFVSNERNFQEVLKKEDYQYLFIDKFGLNQNIDSVFFGNYGHTTTKGSQLIAENVANVILQEVNK